MYTANVVRDIIITVDMWGRDDRLIENSFRAVDARQYGQLELQVVDSQGHSSHASAILKYKSVSLQQRAQKLADLDLLKALAEIGNAMIREHNAHVTFTQSKAK